MKNPLFSAVFAAFSADFGRFRDNVFFGIKNVQNQLETAKAEVNKPFPQEEELRTKSARLNELNAELNIDERSSMERAAECHDDIVAKSAKPSVLGKLKSVQAQIGSNSAKKKSHEEVL